MRPSRTFLFLFLVIITLSLLSVIFNPWKWESVFGGLSEKHATLHPADSAISDTAGHRHTNSPLPAADTPGKADSLSLPCDSLFYSPSEAIRDTVRAGKQFRVMFYGDSQLEGDRMTSYLRKKLRDTSGGTGPGLFSPDMPVMYTRSFVVRASSNWKRYTWLDYKHGRLDSNRFGPTLSLCRFTSPDTKNSEPV
ncbi:MAG TPA: hypothetical protein PLP69_10585, partial [Bacteroidales bacterium]|nr:hypothetical protein [Bacteroidales bacterium]